MSKKLVLNALNKKRAALLKKLAEVEVGIAAAGGNTYIIEYQACWTDKKPRKVTVKHAIDAEDAIRKWRADYHRWDCQGCSGDYPIYDVYLKGHKTLKGEKTWAQREQLKRDKLFEDQLGALAKQFGLKI